MNSCSHASLPVLPSARQIWWALAITSALTFLEVAGAWKSGSMALWGEASHFLADVWGFSVALFALSPAPQSSKLSYGRGQALALGGLINGLLQGIIGLGVAVFAINRFIHPEPIESGWMLVVAGIGFLINLLLLLRFGGAHMHEDDAIEGARIHFVADTGLCAATVLTAAVVHWGGPRWVDAALALLAAGLMIVTAVRLIRRVSHTLLAGTPSAVNNPALLRDLDALPGVTNAHHLHVWDVGHQVMGSVHLACSSRCPDLIVLANEIMASHGVTHATIQVENDHIDPGCHPPMSDDKSRDL